MKNKIIQVNYKEGADINAFDVQTKDLIEQTIAFSKNAYAPYSNFHVSACLILDDGAVIKGTNVENASYPVSICAERTLLSHTVSNYPDNKIVKIAIYVDRELSEPVSPCGVCRQTLLEVEKRQDQEIEVILISKLETSRTYIVFERCSDLLPLYFDGEVL
ncbi:MAG: cytidine deaminase [Arenicella sp.]|jgi:cytidine deaminase